MINPFLDKLKKTQSNNRPLDFILANKQKVNTATEKRNIFKTVEINQDEDRQNIKNGVNTKQIIIQKPIIHKIESNSSNVPKVSENYTKLSDKINLQMKVKHQACQVIKIKDKQLKKINDLSKENIQILVPRAVMLSMQKQISSNEYILNCLSSIYEIIRDNNEVLLTSIKKITIRTPKDYSHINLRLDQYNRLKQGLYFYQPSHNNVNSILKFAIINHVFGKLTTTVSQHFSIDILKAYYVVRSVHEQKGIIKRNLPSFFIDKESIKPLQQSFIIKVSQQFINKDKIKLLQAYCYLLALQKPSASRFMSARQELDILWGNLTKLQRQPLQIQELVLSIFLRYWSLSIQTQKEKGSELYAMKQKIMNMNLRENLKAKVIQIGINDVLTQQLRQMKEADFQGPFKELYLFFIHNVNQPFNYEAALSNLSKIEVSKSWVKHIETYIQRLTLKEDGILKIIYIYKVLSKLGENDISLSSKYLQVLITKVIKEGSIMMGVLFLRDIGNKLYCPNIINLLNRYTQKNLKLIYYKQEQTIYKWINKLPYSQFISTYLQIIQRIIINAITINDITTLQRYVSIAKVYSIDLDQNDDFQFIKYYCQLFAKFPSFHQQIQTNIHELFSTMQSKQLKTVKSFQYYHNKLLTFCTNFKMLAEHIKFIFTIIKENSQIASFSEGFIKFIEKEEIHLHFQNFGEILYMISVKIIKEDSKQLLSAYTQFIRVFKDLILSRVKMNGDSIKVFYGLSSVVEWSKINNFRVTFLCDMLHKVKQVLLKDRQQLTKITQQFPYEYKLFMMCQLSQPNNRQIADLSNYEGQLQIYEKLSICLKDEHNNRLELFYFGANYSLDLLQSLMKNNILDLVNILKSLTFNLTYIHYLLNMAQIFVTSTMVIDQKQCYNILQAIVNKTLHFFANKQMPLLLNNKLIVICSKLMNKVNYATHMQIVRKGVKDNKIAFIENSDQLQICKYYAYLLCLFISRSSKFELNAVSVRNSIVKDIQVFTAISLSLISKNSQQMISFYLSKYLQMLEFYLSHPIFFQFIQSQFISFKQKFKIVLYGNKELLLQFTRIEKMVEDYFLASMLDNFEANFNDKVANLLDQLNKIKQQDKRGQQLRNLLVLLDSHNNYKICIKDTSKIHKLLQNKSLYSLYVVSQLVKKFDFANSKKDIAKLFMNFLLEFQPTTFKKNRIVYVTAIKCFMIIFNQLVGSSSISALILFRSTNIQEILSDIMNDLCEGINLWAQVPKITLFKSLDNIELQTSYVPQEWRRVGGRAFMQSFTIWNLLLYRQKIQVFRQLLILFKNINGLLSKQSYAIVGELNNFIVFYAENVDKFMQKQNKQKINTANKLLKQKDLHTDDFILFEKYINLKQMARICLQIGDSLTDLDVEVQFRTYNIVDKLTQQTK